jgi:hypothetical protein
MRLVAGSPRFAGWSCALFVLAGCGLALEPRYARPLPEAGVASREDGGSQQDAGASDAGLDASREDGGATDEDGGERDAGLLIDAPVEIDALARRDATPTDARRPDVEIEPFDAGLFSDANRVDGSRPDGRPPTDGSPMCPVGFVPCGGGCVNTASDPMHCGGCGSECPSLMGMGAAIRCMSGLCVATCDPGFANCDGRFANGCEVNVGSDPMNCGACGRVCRPGGACRMGVCQP